MNIVDTIAPKRGPGRPRTGVADMTELAAALNAPIPAGIEEAARKVEEAMAAFEVANSAFQESRSLNMPAQLRVAVEKAEDALQEAVIKREVADRLGDDGPTPEEIDALEKALSVAIAARGSSDVRQNAYREATDERREMLANAQQEMWALVKTWVGSVLAAADRQIAEGVKLIAEAQSAAESLDTWQQRSFPDFRFDPVVSGGDWHRSAEVERVEVSPEILRAVRTWRQADRRINSR